MFPVVAFGMSESRRLPFPHAGPWADVTSRADREIADTLGSDPDRDAVVRALLVATRYGCRPELAERIVAAHLRITLPEFTRSYGG